MLLQVKIYLIGTLYFFGALFMLCFPPRNFTLSGANNKIRTKRSTEERHSQTNKYIDYKTMIDLVNQMVEDNKEVVNLVHLTPRTTLNHSLIALELKSDKQSKKPGILIVGALNAMVWPAPNVLIELAERLLYNSNYQSPFFNDYDWYLIPMANPDGLEFTKSLGGLLPINPEMWSQNVSARHNTRPALWNKNIDSDGQSACFGTNVNRNFAYHWQDDVHKMPERCSQNYPGPKPFSTAEANALRAYFATIGDQIELAIHLHASFVPKKEYILYPWRYSMRLPSNYHALQAIGEYAARQARLPDGRLYEVHQSSSENRVAGSISDFLSGVVGIDLVYLLKPYYPMFPNNSDVRALELYTTKAMSAIQSLVRGWRSSNKLNTLYFFGKEIEF